MHPQLFFTLGALTFIWPSAWGGVSQATVERVDSTHVVVTWADEGPVDIFEIDDPTVSPALNALIARNDTDGRFLATVQRDRRPYFALMDDVDHGTVRVAERVLPLERGSNFRDLGGYATQDGKHVRWGLLYRSGATPLLSMRDIAYLRSLDLTAMIDLRSADERELAPSRLANARVRYVAIDYPVTTLTDSYDEVLLTLRPEFRSLFQELLSDKGALVYNCTAGQDRTGIASALILATLGVPRQTILADYHLSTASRRPIYETPAIDVRKHANNPAAPMLAEVRDSKPTPLYTPAGRSILAVLLDHIDSRWGSVSNYLQQELGISEAEQAQLRSKYVE